MKAFLYGERVAKGYRQTITGYVNVDLKKKKLK